MPHQLSQHVNGCAGVSMSLGVAVPVGVEEHRGLVELGAVRANQRFEVVDPAAVCGSEDVIRARPAAVPAAGRARYQRQIGWRCVRKASPHGLFLFDDPSGCGVADRESASDAVVLEVGVDQRVLAVPVLVEADPRQLADFGWAVTGVDQKPHSDAHVRSSCGFQTVEGGDEDGQHRVGQRATGAVALGHRREVVAAEGEVVAEPGHGSARSSAAQCAAFPQHPARLRACLVAFCTNEIERFNDGYKNL